MQNDAAEKNAMYAFKTKSVHALRQPILNPIYVSHDPTSSPLNEYMDINPLPLNQTQLSTIEV